MALQSGSLHLQVAVVQPTEEPRDEAAQWTAEMQRKRCTTAVLDGSY